MLKLNIIFLLLILYSIFTIKRDIAVLVIGTQII